MESVQQNKAWHNWANEIFLLHLGVFLLAIGIHFFKFPNHFVMGGVAGMSVILSHLFPSFSAAIMNAILNFTLLAIGFIFFGRSFGIKTTYTSILLTLLLPVMEKVIPVKETLTDQPVLELFFAFLLPAAGSAILFNIQASSGGTDIIAKIIKKYTSLDIGKALLATDALFTLSTFFVFSSQTALFSVAGLMCKTFMVDSFIEGFNRVKSFTIVTTEPEKVGDFIKNNLHRSATYITGHGLFSQKECQVFVCVVNRYQAVKLRNYIKQVDPHAFISITSTSEIIGKGFRNAP